MAVLQPDDPLIDIRALEPSRPQPSHQRLLHPERPRAPEPVGVPAPQEVAHGEHIGAPLADRAVEDPLSRIVARRFGGIESLLETPQREVCRVPREDDSVQEVDRLAVPGTRRDDLPDRLGQRLQRVERQVSQPDERRHRLDVDGERHGIPEGAVGVGEGAKEVSVRARRRRGDDLARADEDVHRADRFVRQPVPETARLDPQASHGTAHGDGAQLRHDERHDPGREGGVDDALVGRHPLHRRGPGHRVDVDHPGQRRHIQARTHRGRPRAEQVGRPLGQPHGDVRVEVLVVEEECAHGGCVLRR